MSLIRVLLFLVVGTWAFSANAQDAKVNQQKTIKLAVVAVSKWHLRKPSIDKNFCRRWLTQYLDRLDPNKLYFTASDISEFETYLEKLPEIASSGDTKFFKLVAARHQLRVKSAIEHALKRIEGNFDYSIDESITLNYENWPATFEDRDERWRLQLKYDLLLEQSSLSKIDEVAFLKSRYESILKQSTEMTEEREVGLYLDSFCKTAGPYTGYITQSEFERLSWTKRLCFTIGLAVRERKGKKLVSGLSPDFLAMSDAKELVGCELLAIRTQDGTVHSFREIHLPEVYETIAHGMGKKESVTLEMLDESSLKRFAVAWPRRRRR